MTDLAVRTTRLTKRFGEVLAVDGVDLRVNRGEVFGFLGLNGAGKSTTIRLLLGMVRPTAGDAEILGVRVGGARGPWGKVGHLVETPSAWPELSVRKNLQAAGALQGVRDGRAIDRVIERLGLGEHAHRRAGTLSTGNLQRLALARALLHEPELLVLDEPANGLDPAGVVEVRELLRDLARAKGTTVFISSHILAEVDRLPRKRRPRLSAPARLRSADGLPGAGAGRSGVGGSVPVVGAGALQRTWRRVRRAAGLHELRRRRYHLARGRRGDVRLVGARRPDDVSPTVVRLHPADRASAFVAVTKGGTARLPTATSVSDRVTEEES